MKYFFPLVLCVLSVTSISADDVLLRVDDPPVDGLVLAHVDLTAAVQEAGLAAPGLFRAFVDGAIKRAQLNGTRD